MNPETTKLKAEVRNSPDGVILDPFMGNGTTAVVAQELGRNYVGIEPNGD